MPMVRMHIVNLSMLVGLDMPNMNDEPMFDPKEIRSMQMEAIEYCLRQDLLTAKLNYRDRLRRINYEFRFVVRETANLAADIMVGAIPIQFLEN